MTYAQGGLIQAADFNGLLTTGSPGIGNLWSTGSGSQGYGQPTIPTVAQNQLVSHTNWASLFNAVNKAALHQGISITPIPIPTINTSIAYQSALSPGIAAVQSTFLNAGSVGTDIVNSATRTTAWGTTIGIPSVTSTITLTFASADSARFFFNCGGSLLLSCSRSGGTVNPPNAAWTSLCSSIGTVGLPAVSSAQSLAGTSYAGLTQFGATGTPNIYIRNGFYNLTSTPTTLLRQLGGFPPYSSYSSDDITIRYSATSTSVIINVVFTDGVIDTNPLDGSLTVTAIARPPESTYIANSWGTPVVSVTIPS